MGFHSCEYITKEEAIAQGLRNADVVHSSGEIYMTFVSGNMWLMPDMVRLYVELGWVPPQAFIDDIMQGTLIMGKCDKTHSPMGKAARLGWLNPKDNPLPLKMSDQLPAGFLEKLEGTMKKAAMGAWPSSSFRAQTKGFNPKR